MAELHAVAAAVLADNQALSPKMARSSSTRKLPTVLNGDCPLVATALQRHEVIGAINLVERTNMTTGLAQQSESQNIARLDLCDGAVLEPLRPRANSSVWSSQRRFTNSARRQGP